MLKSSARSVIRLRGVRHNNLKNFDLDLPLNQLIVVTGLSGSGKSSLAFDTLFAEGQRRYIETFSPYARQFFDRMDKPQADSIEGIPPAIAIEQRNSVKTTRSTVGTMTEICDYMKLLWPQVAQLHCRQCSEPVRKDSPQLIWQQLNSQSPPQTADLLITFNLPLTEKLSLEESLALVSKQGYHRLLLDGKIIRLEDAVSRITHHASRPPSVTIVQDRLPLTDTNRPRFIEACEQAYHFGKGKLIIWDVHPAERGLSSPQQPRATTTLRKSPQTPKRSGATPPASARNPRFFSAGLHCAQCDIEYREPSPALFSFNHPLGACPTCRGFGRTISIDYNLALPDRSKTLSQGVVKPWQTGHGLESQRDLMRACRELGIPTDVPFHKLPKKWQKFVIDGDPDYGSDEEHEWPRAWYGIKGYFRWLESKAYKMHVRVLLSRYRAYTPCPDCRGQRFQPDALLYRTPVAADVRRLTSPFDTTQSSQDSLTLAGFYQLPIRDSLSFVHSLERAFSSRDKENLALVLSEVRSRLDFLNQVGLGYLTLDRPTRSLSGGETERVNLTTCLGTQLVNTLFVLDEPSVGLHPRDTERLVSILQALRDAGNTVVVVEHEASVIRAADQIVDLGPGHGATGGEIVFQGSYRDILDSPDSLTGQYLSGRKQIPLPPRRPVHPHAYTSSQNLEALLLNDTFPHHQSDQSGPFRLGSTRPLHQPRDAFPLSPSAGGRAGVRGRVSEHEFLKISHASCHNLSDLTVEIPLRRFVCITGVSGSGKTTLVREVLLPSLTAHLQCQDQQTKASDRLQTPENGGESDDEPAPGAPTSASLTGVETLDQVVLVDQSILGKTPRSNPAVYIGAFDAIRDFFAQSELAKQRGLGPSAFSFNSAQGQCQRCRGAGFEKIEMQFLSDVFIRCPDCNGRRYRPHILEIKIPPQKLLGRSSRNTQHATRPLSIADLLDSTVEEAIAFLAAFSQSRPAQRAVQSLRLLQEVGLGYLKLGQPINTLSGGESQRLKLVRHLAEATVVADPTTRDTLPSHSPTPPLSHSPTLPLSDSPTHPLTHSPSHPASPRRTLFLFDEPTTGLHFDDVRLLLKVFQRLVDAGHSVLVVEHNLDVIKSADWVIDLGPGAGDEGGRIVAQGAPEDIAACPDTHTGAALRELLTPAAVIHSRRE